MPREIKSAELTCVCAHLCFSSHRFAARGNNTTSEASAAAEGSVVYGRGFTIWNLPSTAAMARSASAIHAPHIPP